MNLLFLVGASKLKWFILMSLKSSKSGRRPAGQKANMKRKYARGGCRNR